MKILVPLLFTAVAMSAQTAPVELSLMPWPAKVSVAQGRFAIDENFQIRSAKPLNARLQKAVERARQRVLEKTGFPRFVLPVKETPHALEISYAAATSALPKLGDDESYRLNVAPDSAKLDAATDIGVLRGLETFLQLIRADSEGFAAPAVTIDDKPRFQWRGLMLDVSRHWMPVDVVKRTLDTMAAVKMNVFHWHLSDDQGFRVESKRYPKLQGLGSNGEYFTQAQIRDIIAYAADRGIRVVPEFDIPGHSTSWLVGYPELATEPGPYEIGKTFGVYNQCMDPSKEVVYQFLDGFIGEMAALFPDPYFHIGGDEVNGKQWSASAGIKAFLQKHQLKDNHDLQAYFNQRVQKILAKNGKHMEGWDEILHPDLPKTIVIQSWRGQQSLADAARQGYQGILSSGYYVDLMFPASQHYAVDPMEGVTANLTAEEKTRILGGEACMWAEYISAENVDSRIWPRTAAIAERFWSPQEVKDVHSMYRRLAMVSPDLDWAGSTNGSSYPAMLERIAGSSNILALRTLADVVEGVKEYHRERYQKNTQITPLVRLVDAARPESDVARRFDNLVDRYIASKNNGDREVIREALTVWRDNDAILRAQAATAGSFLLNDTLPVSAELSAAASIGLEALEAIEKGQAKDADWISAQTGRLKTAAEPKAVVLIMVVPAVQKLVTAAGGR